MINIKEIQQKIFSGKNNRINAIFEEVNDFENINKELRKDLKIEIKNQFGMDENLFEKIKRTILLNWKILPEDLNLNNLKNGIEYINRKKAISKSNYNFLKKSEKTYPKKVLNILKTEYSRTIENEIINAYFYSFDKKRQSSLRDLISKIDYLEKTERNLSDFKSAFGRFWDLSITDLYKMDIHFIKRMHDFLENQTFLKKIANVLGRFADAQNEFEYKNITENHFNNKTKKIIKGPENTTGVIMGDDLTKILRHQLAYRKSRRLKKIFETNFLEKKMLELEQNIKEFQSIDSISTVRKKVPKENQKGPFILCIDTSGSMHGEPEMIAKAMSMAIFKIAMKEKRKCFIINFSQKLSVFDASDISKNFSTFYDFLSNSFGGGTNITPAIEKSIVLTKEKNFKNADILIISDFIFQSLKEDTLKKVQDLKKNKVRFHGLSIGSSSNAKKSNFLDNKWIYDGTKKSIDLIIESLNKLSKKQTNSWN